MGKPTAPTTTVSQTAFSYTSTKEYFYHECRRQGGHDHRVPFPITPTDYRRQALTFTYLNVQVKSIDGGHHSVQLYTDVSAGAYQTCRIAMLRYTCLTTLQNGLLLIVAPSRSGTTESSAGLHSPPWNGEIQQRLGFPAHRRTSLMDPFRGHFRAGIMGIITLGMGRGRRTRAGPQWSLTPLL